MLKREVWLMLLISYLKRRSKYRGSCGRSEKLKRLLRSIEEEPWA
jgi:hypothetical protein